jgi:hypothetical protein
MQCERYKDSRAFTAFSQQCYWPSKGPMSSDRALKKALKQRHPQGNRCRDLLQMLHRGADCVSRSR